MNVKLILLVLIRISRYSKFLILDLIISPIVITDQIHLLDISLSNPFQRLILTLEDMWMQDDCNNEYLEIVDGDLSLGR